MKKTNGCVNSKVYYYKKKRGSLVDVLCDELTFGEEVYTLSTSGKFIPTTAPSLLLDEYQVSTGWDDNGQHFILVQVADAEMQTRVTEVAKAYGKDFTTKVSHYSPVGYQYHIKIYVEETDFDGNYFDPNVRVRGKTA